MVARRLLLAAACLLTTAAAAPALAAAELPWTACQPTGFQCATLPVPLDRSGATPGQITLNATRVPSAAPNGTAVVALAGGPGQAAVPIASDFAKILGAGLADSDLLVFDQRGTGGSNPLRCAALGGSGSLVSVTAKCSQQLGPARAFFRTADSVADLEALRVAGGYTKLVLYGVSYGTKVAEAYASTYPQNTAALILDSVVPPSGPDAFRRSSLQNVGRVVDETCGGTLCKGITTSASRDIAKLAAKLRRHSVHGPVFSATGRRYTARLTEPGLLSILLAGDLNPTLRAELPGSVRAALDGDVKPILRLSARSAGLSNGVLRRDGTGPVGLQSEAEADSDADFLATSCEENPTFPWTRGAPLLQRAKEAEAAAKALPASVLGPFSRETALQGGVVPICLGWQTASAAPTDPGPLPAVPTLVVEGRADLRTTIDDARSVAAAIPGAQTLTVPFVGHSVLGADPTSCSQDAVNAFFAGTAVAPCPAAAPRFAPTPRPPTRASHLAPYGHITGEVGRTVEALRVTVNDAQAQILGEALALGALPSGAGGLRGGEVRTAAGGLTLHGYEYVPGVFVDGTLKNTGTSQFRLSGADASHGSVRVTQSLAVSGTLGGRRITAHFGRAAAAAVRPFGGLTLRQAVARGRRIRAGL